MRRRQRTGEATPRPPELDDVTVEAWVGPYELPPDPDTLPAHIYGRPLPGEPPEALPYRLLAQARLDQARRLWGASQPRAPYVPVRHDPSKVWHGARDQMPPRQGPPARPRPGAWSAYGTCRFRDRDAFLRAAQR